MIFCLQGNTEKNNQELPIGKQQHQPDQITEAGNQQPTTDHKVHQQPVEKQNVIIRCD